MDKIKKIFCVPGCYENITKRKFTTVGIIPYQSYPTGLLDLG